MDKLKKALKCNDTNLHHRISCDTAWQTPKIRMQLFAFGSIQHRGVTVRYVFDTGIGYVAMLEIFMF